MAYRRINYYRILSMNVSGYRKLRGWNQYELAEKLHISRTYLSIIESKYFIGNFNCIIRAIGRTIAKTF